MTLAEIEYFIHQMARILNSYHLTREKVQF